MVDSAEDRKNYAGLTDLFAQMTALPDGAPGRERLKTRIVTTCLPVAENIAVRYRGRGQSHEDLVQVASIGLMNALNRFDLDKGADFLSFAVPTMMGEVRKHFRDRGWDVRVPRSLQEHYLAFKKAESSLSQCLGREPTVPELAAEVGVEPAEIAEIVAVGVSYNSTSLDAVTTPDGITLGETLGDFDAALEAIDNHEVLRPALHALPERERIIVLYRFFGEMTQIGDRGKARTVADARLASAQPIAAHSARRTHRHRGTRWRTSVTSTGAPVGVSPRLVRVSP